MTMRSFYQIGLMWLSVLVVEAGGFLFELFWACFQLAGFLLQCLGSVGELGSSESVDFCQVSDATNGLGSPCHF